MLFLLKKDQGTDLFYLKQDKEYVIGRKNADVIISDDQSISRKHAVIKVNSNSAILADCGSKYGTVHNNVKIPANGEVVLKDKNVIKFGVFQSVYKMEKLPIITTGSGLTNEQKSDLKNKVNSLGGFVVNNWDNSCTHLTSQELVLTIKVLHAIIDDKPIVTLEFWNEFLKCVKSAKTPPNPKDFKPPVTETLINRVDLSANPERKTLFKGKVFVFTTEKIKKKMVDLIAKTGGTSISWERHPLTLLEVTKSKNKYLLIHNDDPEDIPPTLKTIGEHLKKLGERMIPIQEIAMAIVLCSCEKDCNPKFNRVDKVFKMAAPLDSCTETPLVENTPSDDGLFDHFETKKEIIIPQSLEEELEIFPSPVISNMNRVASTPLRDTFAVPKQTVGGLKRTEGQSGTPPKRIKMDENSTNGKRVEVSCDLIEDESLKVESLIEINDSVVMESVAAPSTSTSVLGEQSESRKRKAEDDFDFGAKKPFAVTRKKRQSRNVDSEDNPFVALRVKPEATEDDHDNPFLPIVNREEPQEQPKPVPSKKVDCPLSFVKKNYVATDTSTIEWVTVKKETSVVEDTLDSTLDPEVREIFEKFKGSVVIEVLPMSAFRSQSIYTQPSPDTSAGKKNFKKFKKVQPRHRQTTILTTSVYEGPASETIQTRSDGEEEEPEEPVRRPVQKKSGRRNFDF